MRKTIGACPHRDNLGLQALVAPTLENDQWGWLLELGLGRILMDCTEACATASGFILRGSRYFERVGRLCASICKVCADRCAQVGDTADSLQACTRCAELCDQLSEETVVAAP